MMGIVHPLSEELGDLVEAGPLKTAVMKREKDTSWLWVIVITIAIGLLAWMTR